MHVRDLLRLGDIQLRLKESVDIGVNILVLSIDEVICVDDRAIAAAAAISTAAVSILSVDVDVHDIIIRVSEELLLVLLQRHCSCCFLRPPVVEKHSLWRLRVP